MIGEIPTNNKGEPIGVKSAYTPSSEVSDLISKIKQDYSIGYNNMHRPYEEFSDRSVLQEMSAGQRIWNSYLPPRSSDPDEAWRAQTVRPTSRNKMISIAAHVTASLIYPTIFAQNDKDEEDKMAAKVMADIVQWVTDQAKYDRVFLFSVISMLINPAAVVEVSFVEAMIKARRMADEGEKVREVLDQLNSGIRLGIVPVDELLIANMREFDIQKQRFLIRRRFIDYDEAKSLYGDHKDFERVIPGIRTLYSDVDNSFYDIVDRENPTLVEEAIYFNRREDVEIPFVNGMYFGKDDLSQNYMKHRRVVLVEGEDIATIPVYKFAKSGYEPIDEMRFFYYKSAAAKLGPDQDLIDTLYNLIVDGAFLATISPVNIFGSEEQDASVVYPGAVNYFSKDAKAEVMKTGQGIGASMQALSMVEQTMSQSSQDDTRQGVSAQGNQTAFEISRMEQNAQIQLGLFGKMIGFLVEDLTYLIIDDIINHLTTAQQNEVLGGEFAMKYNSFLIRDKDGKGKRKIEFTDEIMGEFDLKSKQKALLKRETEDTRILLVNPYQFARMQYLIQVKANAVVGRSEYTKKVMNLEAYDRMITNPSLDPAAVTKDFLLSTFAEGEEEKYMAKQGMMPQQSSQGGSPSPQGTPQAPGGNPSALADVLT